MSRSRGNHNLNVWLAVATACLLPEAALAAAPLSVVISEVNWAGSVSSTADEWVELANPGETDIDVSGWSLWTSEGEPKEQVRIAAGTIPAHGSFLIANNGPDAVFSAGTSTLAVQPDVVASAMSLSNSALKLELRAADGTVVDTAGNGGAPFAGSTKPVVSMERILTPPGDGTLSASWRTATDRLNLDGDDAQRGTPTPSGRPATLPPSPGGNQPTPQSPTGSSAPLPFTTIRSILDTRPTGKVRLQGTVSVPEAAYQKGYLILADGPASIEVSVPDAGIDVRQGDRIELVATVSKAATPRLLLGAAADLTVLDRNQSYAGLPFGAGDVPELYQLLRMTGTAHPQKGYLGFDSAGTSFHLTRKQGVTLPSIDDGDTLRVTALVVSLDPLTARVLETGAVSVTTAGSSAPASQDAQPVGDTADTDAALADEVIGIDTGDEPGEDAAITALASDGGGTAAPSVLGARSSRRWTSTATASALTLAVALLGILVIAGDALWLHLKEQRQR